MLDKLINKASEYSGKTADTIILTNSNRHKALVWLQYAGIVVTTIGLVGDIAFSKIGVAVDSKARSVISELNEKIK